MSKEIDTKKVRVDKFLAYVKETLAVVPPYTFIETVEILQAEIEGLRKKCTYQAGVIKKHNKSTIKSAKENSKRLAELTEALEYIKENVDANSQYHGWVWELITTALEGEKNE